ncbi:ABC transporter permease [Porticoccaceae bacterium LTM1]|nr:ABC transporter permease [Porticoccaceae bacterium LTM1]
MFQSYFQTAFRNLIKDPVYSVISILGLTLGLTCAVTILTYVMYILSYDQDYPDAERIYRLSEMVQYPERDKSWRDYLNLELYKPVLETTNVVDSVAYLSGDNVELSYGNEAYTESIYYTNNSFFPLLGVTFIKGQPRFEQPGTVVLSETATKKYFGNINPLGKTLGLKGELITVTGVFKDFPKNTHLHQLKPDIFISDLGMPVSEADYQRRGLFYVKLKPDGLIGDVERQINQRIDYKTLKGYEFTLRSQFRPIINSHMVRKGDSLQIGTSGTNLFDSWFFIYVLSGLALLVLSISCVNFINFSNARFLKRSREIGVRRVIGAGRLQIFGQFLSESLLLNLVSILLAIVISHAVIPLFGNLINTDLEDVNYITPSFIAALIGLWLFSTILSGLYPSLTLSRMQPVAALQGVGGGKRKGNALRIVNITQFLAAGFLLTLCISLGLQVHKMSNIDYGANLDGALEMLLRGPGLEAKNEVLRDWLAQVPKVESVSSPISSTGRQRFTLQKNSNREIELSFGYVEESFFSHIQTDLLAGRLFDGVTPSDEALISPDPSKTRGGSVILSKAGLNKLGYSNGKQVIGQKLHLVGQNTEFIVVGVVSAFPQIFSGFSIGADLYLLNEQAVRGVNVRIERGHVARVVKELEKKCKDFAPNTTLGHIPPTQHVDYLVGVFLRVLASVAVFAFIAIAIAVLGLYAMSTYTLGHRRKEISVRKVLGASSWRIVRLLLWDFSKPIWIALALACPIAFLLANQIVSHFNDQIPLGLVTFVYVPLVIVLLASLTVAGHTLKAAGTDPVEGLKYE